MFFFVSFFIDNFSWFIGFLTFAVAVGGKFLASLLSFSSFFSTDFQNLVSCIINVNSAWNTILLSGNKSIQGSTFRINWSTTFGFVYVCLITFWKTIPIKFFTSSWFLHFLERFAFNGFFVTFLYFDCWVFVVHSFWENSPFWYR